MFSTVIQFHIYTHNIICNIHIYMHINICEYILHIYVYILFQIHFPSRLLQDIEYSSLCYTVGPYFLSILCIPVCIC